MTYLSVKEAGKIAGKNERTIRRWVNADKIKWTKIKGRYHIDEQSLRDFVGTGSSRPVFARSTGRDVSNWSLPAGPAQAGREEPAPTKSDKQKTGHSDMSEKKSDTTDNHVRLSAQEYADLLKKTELIPYLNSYGINNEKLEEGKDYTLMSGGQKMSELDKNNMSVKKTSIYPIASQEQLSRPVEMSVDSGANMSVYSNIPITKAFSDVHQDTMSGFDGHLSPFSDMLVDNQIDRHGIISSENPFSEGYNKYSKIMSGQIDEMSGHNNRTFELSGIAARLVEEKERVAAKFEEQNDFLKNELTALRKEISALRDIVGGDRKKEANLSQILIEDNRKMRDEIVKNYELRMTNYERELEIRNEKLEIDKPVGAGLSRPVVSRPENNQNKNMKTDSSYVCTCHQPGDIVFDNKYYIIGFWLFAIIIILFSFLFIGWLALDVIGIF